MKLARNNTFLAVLSNVLIIYLLFLAIYLYLYPQKEVSNGVCRHMYVDDATVIDFGEESMLLGLCFDNGTLKLYRIDAKLVWRVCTGDKFFKLEALSADVDKDGVVDIILMNKAHGVFYVISGEGEELSRIRVMNESRALELYYDLQTPFEVYVSNINSSNIIVSDGQNITAVDYLGHKIGTYIHERTITLNSIRGVNDIVLFIDQTGMLYIVNISSGKQLWKFYVGVNDTFVSDLYEIANELHVFILEPYKGIMDINIYDMIIEKYYAFNSDRIIIFEILDLNEDNTYEMLVGAEDKSPINF